MSVTKTDLWYTYNDNLGVSNRRSFADVADTITDVQAQVFGEALVSNDIYPGGISEITKIEKISTTIDEIPLA